uniref:Uncharacterized protein n=1 Tax=Arundo donax TaxID=35708 RepID=A0A0A9SNX7_ARUDO
MYPLVPCTLDNICAPAPLLSNFTNPKSAIFGSKSLSNNMFSGLMSQCTIHSRHSWWR